MGIVDFFPQHAVHNYSALVYSKKSMAAMAEQKCFKDDDQIGTVIFELGNLDAQMPSASQQYINKESLLTYPKIYIGTHSN
jgi:hypothetical protein